MPTYVYRCKSCEHEFETLQKINDDPLSECPRCSGELCRLLFPPSIVFKGSGFHINDYPSSGGNKASASKSTESKTDDKPATKEPATASKD